LEHVVENLSAIVFNADANRLFRIDLDSHCRKSFC
jgi:hypothetical protein